MKLSQDVQLYFIKFVLKFRSTVYMTLLRTDRSWNRRFLRANILETVSGQTVNEQNSSYQLSQKLFFILNVIYWSAFGIWNDFF